MRTSRGRTLEASIYPKAQIRQGADRVSAPTRQGWEGRAGTCHDARGGNGARHDQLTDASLFAGAGSRGRIIRLAVRAA